MKIETLIKDIYTTIQKKDGWFEPLAADYAASVTRRLTEKLGVKQERRGLRLSKMGPKCPRALWYETHHPELAERLPPQAEVKYTYGHMIEALAIMLAKASGHSVTGEQDAVEVDGIVGHRDCIIDGHVVDVKSANSRSFDKFKNRTLAQEDHFGYLDQLDGYLLGSHLDPLVEHKTVGFLLAVDKELGHMVLYRHELRENSIRERIRKHKEICGFSEPPSCECGVVKHGESGNYKLNVKASYGSHKYCCFPNLRTFLYSGGPVYFTKVLSRPKRSDGSFITEVDRHGNVVY